MPENEIVKEASPLRASEVIGEMALFGRHRIETLRMAEVMLLGVMGGAFITAGALLSVTLGSGFTSPGARALAEGFGFSVGFFFVVLSEAALFTEANVVMPASLLTGALPARRVVRFWLVALVGNLVGAIAIGWLITITGTPGPAFDAHLADLVTKKTELASPGGFGNWFRLVGSGVLANWLVGMAAFFSTMGRTIIGKYIPVFLAVTLFVAAGFQHSPANMSYFSLSISAGGGPALGDAIFWNLVPAGLGNVLGGTFMVALPFWLAYGRPHAIADDHGVD